MSPAVFRRSGKLLFLFSLLSVEVTDLPFASLSIDPYSTEERDPLFSKSMKFTLVSPEALMAEATSNSDSSAMLFTSIFTKTFYKRKQHRYGKHAISISTTLEELRNVG